MYFMQLLTTGHVITRQGSPSQSQTYLYMYVQFSVHVYNPS